MAVERGSCGCRGWLVGWTQHTQAARHGILHLDAGLGKVVVGIAVVMVMKSRRVGASHLPGAAPGRLQIRGQFTELHPIYFAGGDVAFINPPTRPKDQPKDHVLASSSL